MAVSRLFVWAALVCYDGLIPLGPDFIAASIEKVESLTTGDLEQNQSFQGVQPLIPGDNTSSKLGFIGESFSSVSDWMGSFVADRGI